MVSPFTTDWFSGNNVSWMPWKSIVGACSLVSRTVGPTLASTASETRAEEAEQCAG